MMKPLKIKTIMLNHLAFPNVVVMQMMKIHLSLTVNIHQTNNQVPKVNNKKEFSMIHKRMMKFHKIRKII